ncbi:penicillin-binding protein 1A [Draconibacterium orientale]|uniref:Penicillin-binding protein 1A n=1 Tax=Draconibacterium orientale TaxID=1168034 RepID=X5DKE3_9BACT|nr:transglycosylase domain-containing protein [Draconibacterium orientale]AHW61017.1 peptidoglycan glycosyltransferase [Draconibacterium orientale]SET56527.1 penicillin-binding protein 1A [Draconibacterium orientale]
MAKKKTITTSRTKKPASRKKGKSKKTGKKYPFLSFIFKAGVVLFLLGCLFFILVFLGVLGPVPSKTQLQQINNPLASEVYSVDGKILGRYYVENRSYATFDEISPNVINALVATEDARFYEHRGIDEIALARVLFKSIILRNDAAGGGSTISQQIAKNLFPRVDYGPFSMPVNKLREAIIAYRLERIYNKQEILALYLNTVSFAENIFGIEVAAERFFSKSPKSLDVHEAAVIVGMLKANNYYNPRTHPDRAVGRRNVVIDLMVKNNYLNAADAEKYKEKPLGLHYRLISYNQGPAPYFLERLKPELLEWCADNVNENGQPYNLYTDGLKITTSIDYNLQRYAQQSVKEYMKNLQKVFDNHWKSRDIFRENPEVLKSAIQNLNTSGDSYADELKKYSAKTHASLFTWDGVESMEVSRLDSLKHYLKMLNAGFIAIDPHSSHLKAWVGGIDYRFFKYDHVTAPRQTGSTFKPFVYLAALEEDISADTYFVNQYKVYEEYKDWAPRNSHNEYGGYYSMKGALAKSLNTVSVDVLLEAGIDETIDIARDLGISADLPDYPSLALGVASVSLKEMVEAFAGIVNDGKPVKANYLLQIADKNGKVLETFNYDLPYEPVVSPENCRAVINMMEAVVDGGTGRGIRTVYKIPGEFAGKTGTTQNNSDGWFIGLTPELVTGCWVGADDPRVHFRTTTYGQGAYMALPIVGKFFYKTYHDKKFEHLQYSTFPDPEPELLAMLNEPEYKEVLDIEKHGFNFASIFGKKETENLKDRPEAKAEEKEKGQLWKKIKGIFSKKDK